MFLHESRYQKQVLGSKDNPGQYRGHIFIELCDHGQKQKDRKSEQRKPNRKYMTNYYRTVTVLLYKTGAAQSAL